MKIIMPHSDMVGTAVTPSGSAVISMVRSAAVYANQSLPGVSNVPCSRGLGPNYFI